ncbi:MAG: DNA repair protein RecO [Alphaproteobacteria bacterium]|nr:DNA repair protein RecO [Alphaproteobacteria bacterium]
MEWRDQGLVLSARKYGETAVIASLLSPERGRHLGLIRGGQSRRRQGALQPGNLVDAVWRARLEAHLGTYTLEPVHDFAARVLEDPLRLKGLAAAMALLDASLAEREAHAAVFHDTLAFLRALEAVEMPPSGRGAVSDTVAVTRAPDWAVAYVRWELSLLDCLGFGLDLSCCAATGAVDDLIYVSPRSGRAVSAGAGAPYKEKLLALPAFLRADSPGRVQESDIAAGLRLTGYFLAHHHFGGEGRAMPASRARFVDAFSD